MGNCRRARLLNHQNLMSNIRSMTLQDYASVKQLWIECGLTDEPEDKKEDIEIFLDSPQSAGFIAQDNEKIVGAVLCGNDGRYGYIHHLAVSKSQRNNGVGRSLVQSCTGFLQRRHIIIMVRENNEVGNEFWKRMCFQRIDGLKIQYFKTNC